MRERKFPEGMRRIVRLILPSAALLIWYAIARVESGNVGVATSLWSGWGPKFIETEGVTAFSGVYSFPPWNGHGLLEVAGSLADILTCCLRVALAYGVVSALVCDS